MGIEQFYTLLIQKIFLDLKGWIAMLKMFKTRLKRTLLYSTIEIKI